MFYKIKGRFDLNESVWNFSIYPNLVVIVGLVYYLVVVEWILLDIVVSDPDFFQKHREVSELISVIFFISLQLDLAD